MSESRLRLILTVTASLLSATCYGAPAGWLATGPFGGAAEIVRVVPKQLNLVLAATTNGLLYQSIDGGASWANRFFPGQFAGILHTLEIDPRSSGTWYAGMECDNPGRAGVYRTDDGGATWTLLSGITGKNVWSLAIWPTQPDVIAAGTGDGIFLSQDAGTSWTQISPDSNRELRPVVALAFHPTDRNILYAGTTHLPWRTRDGGAHWESIHSGMIDDSDVFSIVVDARSPAAVFASACSGVYRSRDSGSSWARMTTPRGAFRTYLVALDARHPGVVFAGTSIGLLRSGNSGTLWTRVSQHPVKSIAFDAIDPDKIYFASATGGILMSGDDGYTLQESNAGYCNRNFTAIAGSGDILYASTIYEPGSGGIFRTSDHGLTWLRMASPGSHENVALLSVVTDDPDLVYAAGYRSLFRSADGAKTWTKLTTPTNSGNITALLQASRGALLVGSAAGLFRLNGNSWSAVEFPGGRRSVELLQGSGGGVVAAITPRGAFLSGDGGSSWTACGQSVADVVWYGLAADSDHERGMLAATSRGLFRSTDACTSWQPVGGGLDRATVSAVVFHPRYPGEAVAAQYGRIFLTIDGGQSWRPLNDQGRNGAYPSALLTLPAAPQLLFGLFPRRGIHSISIVANEDVAPKAQTNYEQNIAF